MLTTEIFTNPVCMEDIGEVGKGMFTALKRIEIASLHPRQTHLNDDTLAIKRKGKFHTTAFVVITDKNILIDGHHTTAAKFINGQKYIFAKCYLFPNTHSDRL